MSILIDLTHSSINDTFPDFDENHIKRDYYVDTTNRLLDVYDVVFVEGDSGIGKTTFLSQFVKAHPYSAISHFITPSLKFSYNLVSLKNSLYRQIYFFIHNQIPEDDNNIEDNFITVLYLQLLKKIKKNGQKYLYFVIDSLNDISASDLNLLNEIISELPWTKAKFVFSGSFEDLQNIIPVKIKHKNIVLNHFGYPETREYFKDITDNENQLREIHSICNNGLPEKLAQVKRICREKGGVETFLKENISEKTNLFEIEWQQMTHDNLSDNILAIISFDESKFTTRKLAEITKSNHSDISASVKGLLFLEYSEEKVSFRSDNHKQFAQTKLLNKKPYVFELMIEYYENTLDNEESLFNLPGMYQKAQKWQETLKFLSLNAFVNYIEKTQSLSSVKKQFDYGLNAAKMFSKFTGDYLRFALYKSSIIEMEKYDIWEVEIEAKVETGHHQQALALANTAILKEDRLKLLALLARKLREKKIVPESILLEQIEDLYHQLDFELIKDSALALAGTLLYSLPELAIDLVEKLESNSDTSNTDLAYAYLSLTAQQANRNTDSNITDIDLIHKRIKDNDLLDLANGFQFFSKENNADDILEHLKKLTNSNRKISLLRKWIINNKKTDKVEKVIDFAINELIISSDIDVPNASSLADFSTPLPHLKKKEDVKFLIGLFDSQRSSIINPVRDYVKLQLNIVEALIPFDESTAKDRLFEIYILIDELSDLSIKVDCLCMLWVHLSVIDKNHKIEKEITSASSLQEQIEHNIQTLLEGTAYHFEVLETVITVLAPTKPELLDSLIRNVNVQQRRDDCYYVGILSYIKDKNVQDLDFPIIANLFLKIQDPYVKDVVTAIIIKHCLANKEGLISQIPHIIYYINQVVNILDSDAKCFAIVKSIKILGENKVQYQGFIDKLVKDLYVAWVSIDDYLERVEIGFAITRDLADYSNVLATEYLNKTITLKDELKLSSSSIANTFVLSIRLIITSLAGLMKKVKDLNQQIHLIAELIAQIQSSSKQVQLWNKVALTFFANKRIDDFGEIVKKFFRPALNNINKNDKYNYYKIVIEVSPTLFYGDARETFIEQIAELPYGLKDSAYNTVFKYILTKKESFDEKDTFNLEYKEYIDLCFIISQLTTDTLIYSNIKLLISSLKRYKLPLEQKNDVKSKLSQIVDSKFPASQYGIKHEGYLIASKADLLTLDQYDKQRWEILVNDAKSITNLSDKTFVLALISDTMNTTHKPMKKDILDQATDFVKTIPSNFDKSKRYDTILPICIDVAGNNYFDRIAKEAITSFLQDKEGNLTNINNIIDIAERHDTKLTEHVITLLDQDPARKKMKIKLEKRVEKLKRIKKVKKDLSQIALLTAEETQTLAEENLKDLNSGKYNSKEIEDTLAILDKISGLPLVESFELADYFITNAVKKIRK